jgi:hypothetical protein
MTWPEWPEVQRLTIVAIFLYYLLWQHEYLNSALAGFFLTG